MERLILSAKQRECRVIPLDVLCYLKGGTLVIVDQTRRASITESEPQFGTSLVLEKLRVSWKQPVRVSRAAQPPLVARLYIWDGNSFVPCYALGNSPTEAILDIPICEEVSLPQVKTEKIWVQVGRTEPKTGVFYPETRVEDQIEVVCFGSLAAASAISIYLSEDIPLIVSRKLPGSGKEDKIELSSAELDQINGYLTEKYEDIEDDPTSVFRGLPLYFEADGPASLQIKYNLQLYARFAMAERRHRGLLLRFDQHQRKHSLALTSPARSIAYGDWHIEKFDMEVDIERCRSSPHAKAPIEDIGCRCYLCAMSGDEVKIPLRLEQNTHELEFELIFSDLSGDKFEVNIVPAGKAASESNHVALSCTYKHSGKLLVEFNPPIARGDYWLLLKGRKFELPMDFFELHLGSAHDERQIFIDDHPWQPMGNFLYQPAGLVVTADLGEPSVGRVSFPPDRNDFKDRLLISHTPTSVSIAAAYEVQFGDIEIKQWQVTWETNING